MSRCSRFRAAFRTGDFLTPARIRHYSLIALLVTLACLLWLITQADSRHNLPDGQPLGVDYSDIYSAGRMALANRASAAYDWGQHHAMQQRIFGPDTPFYAWSYPPVFFLLAIPLALLPYLLSLAVWQGASLAFYLTAIRRIAGDGSGWLWPALGFPAVLINIANGHNGLLSAGLFGLGLALLERRPILAGALLGALCYKPQLGLLIPLVLLVSGRGRAFIGASATVLALGALTTLWLGPEIWLAFIASLAPTSTVLLEQGSTGWYKMQSLFAVVRALDGSVALAYGLQLVFATLVALATAQLWRSAADISFKAAGLITAALLVTPYSLDYDLTILGPALAFLAARGLRTGFLPYEKALLGWLWLMPLLARTVMKTTGLPLGFLSLLLGFLFCVTAARETMVAAKPANR